jgi:tRNA(Ile)-lysidine synthase
VESFAADARVVPPGVRVLAAVSSGADSMALLCWLLSLDREVIVGHVNHALHELRPGECARDEEFVHAKCQALGVEFRSITVDLPRRSAHVNEVVAREARYRALSQIARQTGCPLVATAHTATDGLETALLNLLRGGGPGGWLGIAPIRILDEGIDLVRPFWPVPRDATRQLLRENGWEWREDASNLDPLFRRNRIRGEILPLLGDISGQHPDHLGVRAARNAQIARDEARFLDQLTAEALEALLRKRDEGLVVLDGIAFGALDVALQRRVLRRAAQWVVPEAREVESTKIEATRCAACAGAKRAVWTWRKDLRVEWTGAGAGNRLRFWVVRSN